MRVQDIKLGEYYRYRDGLLYGYAKALKIIKPMAKFRQKYAYDLSEEERTIKVVCVKCEWSLSKNDKMVFIKYFRPCDLVKE